MAYSMLCGLRLFSLQAVVEHEPVRLPPDVDLWVTVDFKVRRGQAGITCTRRENVWPSWLVCSS